MPIKIPDNLPAFKTLSEEGVSLIGTEDARRQDIRPIKIAILNLMPEKIPTETQLARVLGSTPLQVDLTLLQTSSYTPKNTSVEHMKAFYRSWEDVKTEKFDGLIITGAPVETLELMKFSIGKNWFRSWIGQQPMFSRISIFVGGHRQRFIISILFRNTTLRGRLLEQFGTKISRLAIR